MLTRKNIETHWDSGRGGEVKEPNFMGRKDLVFENS